MTHKRKVLILGIVVLTLGILLACAFSASTANIRSATLARDAAGEEPTTVFAPEDIFYCIVDLANAPDDTKVRATWTAVDVEGSPPNTFIDETALTTGSGQLNFDLSNVTPWPSGKYQVALYLNDELDQTLEFEVRNETAAPTQSGGEIVSKVEPTSTPTVAATAEATVAATATPTGITLELINNTETTITYVYISATENTVWGESWLNGSIPAGGSRIIEGIEPGYYDLQVGNAEGSLETLYAVPLGEVDRWTIWGTVSLPDNAVLRFEEYFEDNRNNWGGDSTENVDYLTPSGGEYCMRIKTDQMTAWEWYEPFRPDEFFAEVKCTVDPNTDASCGIGFGPDGDNLFWYEIDPETQSYAVFLLQDDQWQTPLASWDLSYHVNPSGRNYLGLGRTEGTLYVYVNGVLIDSFSTALFPTGRIGIGGATYSDPNVTVCLDELRVWRIEK